MHDQDSDTDDSKFSKLWEDGETTETEQEQEQEQEPFVIPDPEPLKKFIKEHPVIVEETEPDETEQDTEIKNDSEPSPIIGYRELTQQEINLINTIKKIACTVGSLYDRIEYICHTNEIQEIAVDERWLKMAGDQLQTGFMCLTRSIAKPDTF